MKPFHLPITILILTLFLTSLVKSQVTDDILNILIQKKAISQQEADSIRSESALKNQRELKNESFVSDLEVRPRTEYRNGFRQLRTDTSSPSFFTSQRTRLNLAYKREKLTAVLSLQDIRTWGAADPRSTAGSIQVFEAFVEPYFNSNLSARLGKQRIMYDNQRLFAQNDWRQNSGTHDAVTLRYYKARFETELAFAYNQSKESLFFTDFSPTGFTQYKSLGVSYLRYKTKNDKWVFTSINYFEGFQITSKKLFEESLRYTDGGRIECIIKNLYLTVSGYIQHGKNSLGKKLEASYIQSEAKFAYKKTTVKVGAELKSGNDPSNKEKPYTPDHAFQYPYGVAHRFNGTMEYFASGYPGSANDVGLINPYIFLEVKLTSKFSLSAQNHFFYSQYRLLNKSKKPVNTFLGFENDLLLIYQPNSYTKLDLGFSWLLPTESMEILSGGNKNLTPHWVYVQITITPKLFSIKK